jgi:replicative DNA helicase
MSADIEGHLIGAALIRPALALAAVDTGLEPADFAQPRTAHAWAVLRSMTIAGEPVDAVTLAHRLAPDARNGEAIAWLLGLYEPAACAGVTEKTAAYLAEQVRDGARLRRFSARATELARAALQSVTDARAWISEAQADLLRMTEDSQAGDEWSAADLAQRAARRLDDLSAGNGPPPIPTGLEQLDEMGLLERGAMTALCARPRVGKTALALNVGVAAARAGRRVLIVSIEMPELQVVNRLLGIIAGVRGDDLRPPYRAAGDARTLRAMRALSELDGLRLWCPDAVTDAALTVRVQRHAIAAPLDLVIVDYLQQIRPAERVSTREQEVARASAALISIAKRHDCAVLALVQLNREAERETPRLHHLRESGAIEADASVVGVLQRPGLDDPTADLDLTTVTLLKSRNGHEGQARLRFDGSTQRFRED